MHKKSVNIPECAHQNRAPRHVGPDVQGAVVLCKGLLDIMGLPSTGRRNRVGSLFGPRTEEYLNGSHPAMLAVQGNNSDVQLPYRFPVTAETHCSACVETCIDSIAESKIIESVQVAQDAQAGYACDYCNKRQPMAFNEVKECCSRFGEVASPTAGRRD